MSPQLGRPSFFGKRTRFKNQQKWIGVSMNNVVSIFKNRLLESSIGRISERSANHGWSKLNPIYKRHFLARVQAGELESLSWCQLSEPTRAKLTEIIRDNPRCGPDLGLVPRGGVYSTGETYFEAVQRKTRENTWT